MRRSGSLQVYLLAVLVAGTASIARGESDPVGDIFMAPDPGDPAGSTTPDITEVNVW